LGRWDRAADKARERAAEAASASRAAAESQQRRQAERERQVGEAAQQLEDFLNSADGQSAVRLLAATGTCISFGISTETIVRDFRYRWIGVQLGADGLEVVMDEDQSISRTPARTRERADARLAVAYYATHGAGKTEEPATVIDWLISEIDDIATRYAEGG
jgi:hypothetical protein